MVNQLSVDDQEKLAQLRRVKALATGVLVLCFLAMVCAKLLEAKYPSLAFVAAFAEAATIGGIADWYAVVALFKHPLNLPIPHTAIIPANQNRIADNLGSFIENNFLSETAVRDKLEEVDFAGEMVNWLSDRQKSASLAEFATRLVPQMLNAIDERGLRKFAAKQVTNQLAKTDVAPLAAEILDTVTRDRRHQRIMDEIIVALHRFLNDEVALKSLREKVHEELPTLLNFFRADAAILNRIVKAASDLLDEIKENPDHELRQEFEQFLKGYVTKLKKSKAFRNRVESFKQQLLDRPELASIAEDMWSSLRKYIEDDVKSKDPVLVERLTGMFVDVARNLNREKRLKREINAGMVAALSAFVGEQKSTLSAFITDQVKSWDFRQLTRLLEANIGRDLQYIRFNGMIIGGFVGLVLYGIELLVL